MDLGYFETSLPVKDIEASMAFYEAVGFARAEYARDAGTATMIRSDCRLGLFQGGLDPDRPQLIFWQGPVEDVAGAAERAGLKTRVALRHDVEGGAGLKLDDPDGHPLHFIRMKTFYPQHPAHTRGASPDRPAALAIEAGFGWCLVGLPVEDMDRSVAFYEALGFQVVDRMADNRHVTLQNADCRIGLYKGYLKPERLQLIFCQGDVLGLAEGMRSAGLRFHVEPAPDPEHSAFMVLDPDGHPLFFIRMPGMTRAEVDATSVSAA